MTRLTHSTYVSIHNNLRLLWLRHPQLLGRLSPRQQWHLHRYFVPDQELSDLALRAHRVRVTEAMPSLPQCAGRAYRALHLALDEPPFFLPPHPSQESAVKPGRRLSVVGVVRPDIDTKLIAMSIVNLAMELISSLPMDGPEPDVGAALEARDCCTGR
jgi:hypothetical protein